MKVVAIIAISFIRAGCLGEWVLAKLPFGSLSLGTVAYKSFKQAIMLGIFCPVLKGKSLLTSLFTFLLSSILVN